jgi:hypothetical protein
MPETRAEPLPLDDALPARQGLFFEAGTVFTALWGAHLAVVGTDFGHRAVAPAMPNIAKFVAGSRKHLVRLGGNIHFLCPKIFAEIWIHNHAVS